MRIAVLGATGTVGRPLAATLERQGHEIRRLHRSSSDFPVDLASGEGLTAALDGVEAIVHAANQAPPHKTGPVMIDGTRRVLQAAPAAHHVLISIVGIDQTGPHYGYYAAKLEQERAVVESGAPHSILRATQFHEFVGAFMTTLARYRLHARSRVQVQPVAASEVAGELARVAGSPPTNTVTTMAGPQTLTLSQLRADPRPAIPVPVPIPGTFGRLLRAGALTDPAPDVRGRGTYAEWLGTLSAARGS